MAFQLDFVVLTVAGRSQHLSRLTQLKLQIISNIWSWNYTTEEGEGVLQMAPILDESEYCYKQQQPRIGKYADVHSFRTHWEQF